MATYHEVKKQIAALEAKAELLRKAEAARIIKTMKAQIAKYGLRVSDLFDEPAPSAAASSAVVTSLPASKAARVPAKKSRVLAPKYMDPVTKKTWTGQGKPPAWIKQGKRESFLIEAVLNAKPVAKAATKPAKKSVAIPAAKKVAKQAVKPAVKAPAPTAKVAAAKTVKPQKAAPMVKPAAPKKAAVKSTTKPAVPQSPAKKAATPKAAAKSPVAKKVASPKAVKAPVVQPPAPAPAVEIPTVAPTAVGE